MTETWGELDEVVTEFLVESAENLDQLDADLVALEAAATPAESTALLGSVFRTIHTIKGTSGFLAFPELERVAHVGETLLARLRDRELTMSTEIADGLLRLVDAVRGLLAGIEATGSEPTVDHTDLVADLTLLASGVPAQAGPVEPRAAEEQDAMSEPGSAPPNAEPGSSVADGGAAAEVHEQVTDDDAASQELEPPLLGELLISAGAVTPQQVAEALEVQSEQASSGRRSVADSSVRVDVDLLDSLMRLVGELVLARNQVLQHTSGLRHAGLQRASQRLNIIASELQEGVMKTRMQTVDTLWGKLPRIVRDLGQQCGKQVRLVLEGGDTEIDRSLLEAVKDPLTHLVRNAVDHGLETSEQRLAAGKPEVGTVTLRAYHEGGQVVVDVSDDGAGMNPDKIGAKAVERGLATRDQISAMSAREVLAFIFSPGFSTARAVTNVSGRGVGMDVVKTNIERVGGSVELDSRVGQGSTVRVTIPLTLAIIPALTVSCAGHQFAIPQASLLELVRLDTNAAVEHVAGAPVHRLRGRLLPLVFLREVLVLGGTEPADVHVVVLQVEGRRFGLVVDDVSDTQEIVVKPLGGHLKELRVYAGATIMGDGRVSLILDASGLARHAGVGAAGRPRPAEEGYGGQAESAGSPLLVVGVGDDRRAAVPLGDVARLEELPASTVEWAGGREVVQYRDGLLPLLRLSKALGVAPAETDRDSLDVVVWQRGDQRIGLVVDGIHDVADHIDGARLEGSAARGVIASVVVHDRVTDLVDVVALLAVRAA